MNMRGFSLVEIMVGLAILSGLGATAMKISDNQRAAFEFQESKGEELEVYNQIRYMMQDKAACEATLNGVNVSSPATVETVLNDAGSVFITTGINEGRHYDVQPFTVSSSGTSSGPNGERTILFTVNILRLKGIKTVFSKDIYLSVILDGSENFVSCLSEQDSITILGKGEMCRAVGGVFLEGPPETCELTCPDPMLGSPDGDITALSTLCAQQFKERTGSLDDTYAFAIDKDGDGLSDTITGPVTVNGNIFAPKHIEANVSFCVAGNCQTFAASSCSPGQVVIGIDGSGNPVCVSPGDCGANRYFKGINASGNAICENYNTTPPCPDGQFVDEVRADGSFVCATAADPPSSASCPSGQYIVGIDSDGNAICGTEMNLLDFSCPVNQVAYRMTMGTFECRVPTLDRNVYGTSCPANQFIQGFNADGTVICASAPACSPSSPAASTICDGVTETGNDGCGGSYNVAGTKTTGECESAPPSGLTWNFISTEGDDIGLPHCSTVNDGDSCSTSGAQCANGGGSSWGIYQCN